MKNKTELKTLKEMDLKYPVDTMEKLRAKAVKWVKEIRSVGEKGYNLKKFRQQISEDNIEECLNVQDPYEPHGTEEAIKWIKHFFNLTEADLK